ncbi:MAG TPA: hypothetical protein VIR34_10685, partial [Gemmatimonadaceae bacterium]
ARRLRPRHHRRLLQGASGRAGDELDGSEDRARRPQVTRSTRPLVTSLTRSPSDFASSIAARPASLAWTITSVATTFTRRAGFARVFRARVAALFALDVRFLAELFLAELFFVALFLVVVLFLDAPFLAVALFLRAVAVLRLRVLPARPLPVLLFFAALLRFLVLVERFLGDAPLFDAERALLARLRPVLRLLVPLRLVDFRPADFALEVPRDDFLVVAIHALRVSR